MHEYDEDSVKKYDLKMGYGYYVDLLIFREKKSFPSEISKKTARHIFSDMLQVVVHRSLLRQHANSFDHSVLLSAYKRGKA